MGVFTLVNAAVKINSVDLSDHIQSVEVTMTAPGVDITRDDSFTMNAYSDSAAGKVDATLYPLFSGASLFLVEVWASGTTTSSTNPKYSGTCILTEYSPKIGRAS